MDDSNMSEDITSTGYDSDVTSTSDDVAQSSWPVSAVGTNLMVYILLAVAALVGTAANSLLIFVILTKKTLRTITNLYVLNVACADLLMCAAYIPVHLKSTVLQEPPTKCRFWGLVGMLCVIMSVLGFTALATNRYIRVTKRADVYSGWYTKNHTYLSIMLLWMFGFFVAALPLMGFGTLGFNQKIASCFVGNMGDHPLNKVHFYMTTQGIMQPCIFWTAYCYIKIYLVFRDSRRKIGNQVVSYNPKPSGPTSLPKTSKTTLPATDTTTVNEYMNSGSAIHVVVKTRSCEGSRECASYTDTGHGSMSMETRPEEEGARSIMSKYRVVRNLFILWCSFMTCWMPTILLYMLDYKQTLPHDVQMVAVNIAYASSALNPVIYIVLNQKFLSFLRCG